MNAATVINDALEEAGYGPDVLNPAPKNGGFMRCWQRMMNVEIEPCPSVYEGPSDWVVDKDGSHNFNLQAE